MTFLDRWFANRLIVFNDREKAVGSTCVCVYVCVSVCVSVFARNFFCRSVVSWTAGFFFWPRNLLLRILCGVHTVNDDHRHRRRNHYQKKSCFSIASSTYYPVLWHTHTGFPLVCTPAVVCAPFPSPALVPVGFFHVFILISCFPCVPPPPPPSDVCGVYRFNKNRFQHNEYREEKETRKDEEEEREWERTLFFQLGPAWIGCQT